MKPFCRMLCTFVLVLSALVAEIVQNKNPKTIEPQMRNQKLVERKNQQISAPLPFTNDLSTKPLTSQAFNTFQNGFGNAFGGMGHDPNQPTFSVDPQVSSGLSHYHPGAYAAAAATSMMPPVAPMPFVRNPHSLTRFDEGDNSFDKSLSSSTFPELRVKRACESIQRQAIQVANNLVKRQNKVIFKELMDYILKSKFLIGMTEVKLNRVLKKKFISVMKRNTIISEDNVRLITSDDDEYLDTDLDDENDIFSEHEEKDPFSKRHVDVKEEAEFGTELDDENKAKSLSDPEVSVIDNSDETMTDVPEKEEKKSWYDKLKFWRQKRALKAKH